MNSHFTGIRLIRLFLLLTFLPIPSAVYGQGASIAGVVTDASSGVLPGVIVEASSPALIEKVRTAVTDEAGQYKIEQLRPGLYVVTFTLPGFNTVRREGVELSGSAVATVSVELRVGGIEETITVTGAAPLVDLQSATREQVLKAEEIAALPTGRHQYNLAVLTPGVTTQRQDVGGTDSIQRNTLSMHGSSGNDQRVFIDGLSATSSEINGNNPNFVPNMGSAQEVVVGYAAGTAETQYGGIQINLIPKEGGNRFTGTFFGTAATSALQGNNFTEELKNRGLREPGRIHLIYDYNPGVGGPILRDSLWFYSSARWITNQTTVPGDYENLNAGRLDKWTYEPDLSRPAVYKISQQMVNTRLTWQAAEKHKIGFYYDFQRRQERNIDATWSPEAVAYLHFPREEMAAVYWTSPVNDRLLLDLRLALRNEGHRDSFPEPGDPYRLLIPVEEQSTGLRYRGRGLQYGPFIRTSGHVWNTTGSLSYVTGSHAYKFGFWNRTGGRRLSNDINEHNVHYRFNRGIPNQLTQYALPIEGFENLDAETALYAQDRWTIKRLTLNLGVRYDYFAVSFPEQHVGPTPLTPTWDFTFPHTPFVSWKNLNPRMAGTYDLFGTGKTALKVSLNKYPISWGLQSIYGDRANPVRLLAFRVNRAWNDIDGDYFHDCDLRNLDANGECGRVSDLSFGSEIPSTEYDPDAVRGWNKRPDNWEFSAGLEHEVLPSTSVDVAYYRRWFGNKTVYQNRSVRPSDFSPFSITAPLDPRLPGGGGYEIAELFDLNPDKVGQVDNILVRGNKFGEMIEYWHGVDVNVEMRMGSTAMLRGGFSTGRRVTDDCDVVTKGVTPTRNTVPSSLRVGNPSTLYCRVVESFQTSSRVIGTYTIPKVDVQFAAVFQSLPGQNILANYNAPNALVAPSLGRNLSGNAANVTVGLVEPGTLWGDRLNQLDLRVTKGVKLGRTRTFVNVDLYNALNSSAILNENNNYAAWRRPFAILLARFAKISVQFDF